MLEIDKSRLECDFRKKLVNLNKIHNKDIKWIKRLLLNCNIFVTKLERLLNDSDLLISYRNLIESEKIIFPKQKGPHSSVYVYFSSKILDFNYKVKDINKNLKILPEFLKDLQSIIFDLNHHYRAKYKCLKERRLSLRRLLDSSIFDLRSIFYKSTYFINEVDNYIILNNSNQIFNMDFIYKVNKNYWTIFGKYKYKNVVDYRNFLVDTWFK